MRVLERVCVRTSMYVAASVYERASVCVFGSKRERERENYDRMGVSKKEMEYQGVFRKVLKERKRKRC